MIETDAILELATLYNQLVDKTDEADKKLAEIERLKVSLEQEIENVHQLIAQTEVMQKGEQGEPGESIQGDKGDMGESGQDADEEKIIQTVLSKIPIPKDGKDAVIDEGKIIKSVVQKIKIPKDGKDGKDGKNGKSIKHEEVLGALVKHLETGKVKIKTEHIDGWKDPESVARRFLHGGQGSWKSETPGGAVDGVNKVFTLKNKPATNSLILHLNQGLPIENSDYTLSGSTVTYTTAPPTGSVHLAKYL